MSGPPYSLGRRAAAWGVHAFTMLGLPLCFVAAKALADGDAGVFFLAIWATAVIDSVDGAMARAVEVKKVVPGFDGALLDNLIDFLTFVFLPVIALPALGLLEGPHVWWAMLPLVASGYQFCQAEAKTEQSFVGFPSYWNVVVLYLYVLDASLAWVVGMLVVLSALVFVPTHYLYPSRTRFLRWVTVPFGALWGVVLIAMCFAPDAPWIEPWAWASVSFPVYYFVASFFHHPRWKRELARRAAIDAGVVQATAAGGSARSR